MRGGCARWRSRAASARPWCPECRAWRKPACRITRSPSGTASSFPPAEVVKRLFDATGVVLQNAEVSRALAKEGTETSGSRSPQDFAAFLAGDTLLWTRLVKDSGAKPD